MIVEPLHTGQESYTFKHRMLFHLQDETRPFYFSLRVHGGILLLIVLVTIHSFKLYLKDVETRPIGFLLFIVFVFIGMALIKISYQHQHINSKIDFFSCFWLENML